MMREESFFSCHPLGYIRHWLVAGPRKTPYKGPPGDEDALRREALDPGLVEPPASAILGAPSPLGEAWRLYYPGENFFVEYSGFHFRLAVLDSYAFVELESEREGPRETLLWAAGTADLWVNETHVTRFEAARYMFPDYQPVSLPLREGVNRLCVRLQCFGVRDTRTLFGLQLADTDGISVRVPGCAQSVDAANWLDGVQTEGRDAVVSLSGAPSGASVVPALSWPGGSTRLSLGGSHPFALSVEVVADGQTLRRSLEIPANRAALAAGIPADLRAARLEFIASLTTGRSTPPRGKDCHLPLLARRLLARAIDAEDFAAAVAFVDGREDCADFVLATLLRLETLGLAAAGESAEIRRVALAFRYWPDEPGNDAMCFGSENHSLLFHGCQWIAGRLYPADLFSNSSRNGATQATLGAARCREWFDRIERRGFEEFNSGTYLPITIGALLNVADFSGDAESARRARALIDSLYEDMATHAFHGIVVSPQGRVYRNVLYPGEAGSQTLLSDATSKARAEFPSVSPPPDSWTGDWLVYPASSPSHRPPGHLGRLMEQPVSKRYCQAGAEIVLHKTPDYLLTSLSIPAPLAGKDEGGAVHLQPGRAGYQQHLWQATLGPECHVFVNHPGASFDGSASRPGYWHGNGVLPRLRQREGTLQAIFDIPDGSKTRRVRTPAEQAGHPGGWRDPFDLYPIPFTHAYWPSDAFDRHATRADWLFGRKDTGCVGLWCSEPLRPHHDVLTGREFRAWAYRSAWAVVCGNLTEHGSLESFMEFCLARQPRFDRAALSLQMKGEAPLRYHGRPKP